MVAEKFEAISLRVAAAEHRAVEARAGAELLAEEARQLVASCFAMVTSARHQSAADAQRARAELVSARELLARADKLTQWRKFLERNELQTAAQECLVNLPGIELVAARVHEAWMQNKRRTGVTTQTLESGEELTVPYEELSEDAKQLDRATVRSV
jgi:hypothetical protein